MGNSWKHTKAIYFTHNRDIWAFRGPPVVLTPHCISLCSCWRTSLLQLNASASLMSERQWTWLLAAHLFCVRDDGFYSAVIRLQQKPLFAVCLCGSFQRLVGFVWGDYRQGACRSYLFIQVHASIPHSLSSSLSVERSSIFYKRGCAVSLYWAAKWFGTGGDALKGAVGRASRSGRRVPLHFSVNFHYCNSHSLSFARINVKRSKANKFGWVHSSI